jgi:hypothetical protein
MNRIQKNKIVGIITAIALVTMFTVNIRYSLNGYGIKSMNLHPEVWAQTNGTGGSTSGGSTTGGSTSGGSTTGGSTSGGKTTGGSTSGGNTTGGSTLSVSVTADKTSLNAAIKYETKKVNGNRVSVAVGCEYKFNSKCSVSATLSVRF